MKNNKKADGFNENIEDYTAQIFHSHALLGFAAVLFSPYIQYEFIKDTNYSKTSIINSVILCFSYLVLLVLGLVVRRYTKRFEKNPKTVRWCLDLINMALAAFFAWSNWQKSDNGVNTELSYVAAWWNSLVTFAVLNTISRWYLKILAYSSVVFCFYIKTHFDTGKVRPLLILCEVMLYFVLSNYLSYRDSKKKFFEKQKLYEETQTFKEMLDQTTDGILIYGIKEGLMYRNWEKKKYKWWKEGGGIEENLRQIKIDEKKSNMNLITQVMALDTTPDATTNESDLWDLLLKMTQNFNLQMMIDPNNAQQTNVVRSVTGKFEYNEEEERMLKEKHHEGVLEIRIMPLCFRDKPAVALIFHDITERSRVSILEDNNNYKNRLLASVSHELRTPLNASINFIQAALDDSKLPENIRDNFLLPSLASNRLLMFLINDILDFSQMAANKLRLVYEKADVKKTIEECIDLVRMQAKRKELSLDVKYRIDTSSSEIYTDHNRLKQIILNLLTNAIKFTLEGGIQVRVKLVNSSEYNNNTKILNVEVEDTGIGISEEDQERLFKAFEKIDLGTRISINSHGVGLGLVISNNLVQMLGSSKLDHSIKVTSSPNKGSNFSFTIVDKESIINSSLERIDQSMNYDPVMSENVNGAGLFKYNYVMNSELFQKFSGVNRASNPTVDTIDSSRPLRCNCPKVLVVDDDVFNITALKIILDKLGFVSDAAYNGEQAIKKILQRQDAACASGCGQYKLVFMDYSMPILDGFEATKRLRAMMGSRAINSIPIIGCTAFVQAQDKQRAIDSGMNACCTKPLDRGQINCIMKEFLSKDYL